MNSNPRPGDEKLSQQLGADVDDVEDLVRFRLDHARMMQGRIGELGYIRMKRQHNSDAIIVFDTIAEAKVAADEHPLIDDLAQEDCLACDVLVDPVIADLAGCEVILP